MYIIDLIKRMMNIFVLEKSKKNKEDIKFSRKDSEIESEEKNVDTFQKSDDICSNIESKPCLDEKTDSFILEDHSNSISYPKELTIDRLINHELKSTGVEENTLQVSKYVVEFNENKKFESKSESRMEMSESVENYDYPIENSLGNIKELKQMVSDIEYQQYDEVYVKNDEYLKSILHIYDAIKKVKDIKEKDLGVCEHTRIELIELLLDDILEIKKGKEEKVIFNVERLNLLRRFEEQCLKIMKNHQEKDFLYSDGGFENQIEIIPEKFSDIEYMSLSQQPSLFENNHFTQVSFDLLKGKTNSLIQSNVDTSQNKIYKKLLFDENKSKLDYEQLKLFDFDVNSKPISLFDDSSVNVSEQKVDNREEIIGNISQKLILNQIVDLEKNKPVINVSNIDLSYENTEFDINDLDSYISLLVNKIRQDKLIGYDLLQIAGNVEVKNKIHKDAIYSLRINCCIRNANHYKNTGIIVISLILIALDYYDGNYWSHVREVYKDLYDTISQQKIEARIREILSTYSSGENRYINFVIRNAITPRHYLPDFISFVFDIYKNTFRYELMENLNEPLTNVFLDLNDNYENENGYLETKDNTYKLIKTTKDIINNVNWFGELIAYTKLVLRYIDFYYWDDKQEKLPYFDFFADEISCWIAQHDKIFFDERKKEHVSNRGSIWKAKYELQGHKVYLTIPNHLISNRYEPQSIRVNIYEDNVLVDQLFKPEIILVMGGYKLSQIKVKLNNPLGKIRYEIVSGNEVIFSSENKMYREYLLFNEKHTEIFKGNKYIGNIDTVININSVCDKLDIYYTDKNYQIGNIYVDEFDSFVLDDEEIFFTLIDESKIVGKTYEKTLIMSI